MNKKAYWVGFNLVKGIGAVRLGKILEYFGDLEIAWKTPKEAFMPLGFGNSILNKLQEIRSTTDLSKVWDEIEEKQIDVITWEEKKYPRRLKEIEQPPPVLYVKGKLLEVDDWAVAIVGTRRKTVYGVQMAERISAFLAGNGISIISGLARGIDSIAHSTALHNHGRTVAVLGCGVDRIYPPENKILAEKIINQGALISDYPLGTPPDGSNFPPRNRIISGLSKATVVVEAGKKSGAMITAKFAADQGREVFAIPGNLNSLQSQGTNWLIQQGARPLLDLEELLECLDFTRKDMHEQARRDIFLDDNEKKILSAMGSETLHIDEIMARAEISIDVVSSTLAIMELKGMVRHSGGKNYYVIYEEVSPYGTK